MKTKLFTLLFAVAASIGTLFAESGTCGENLKWDLTDGVLTISGSGDMTDWFYSSQVPWNSYRKSITSVTIGNGVTSIGDCAFCNCGLTSVTIPNSVTSIGDWAFADCSGLTSVTIGNSVTTIGEGAFSGCSGLTSIVWNAKNCQGFSSKNTPFYYYTSQYNCDLRNQITSFVFGEEVEHIPANLCNGMTNLTSVVIPNSVTSIGGYAFSGCSGLTSITIPNSVTSIGDGAFAGCDSLTSVTIPNSVTSIGDGAFFLCYALTSINIPNSVTNIGNSAFSGCSGLTTVTIPNSVTNIGNDAFSMCTGLTAISIPSSVTYIGSSAFSNCSGLTSVEAPANFFDIDEIAWPYYTKILQNVRVNADELSENELLFINRSYKTLKTLDVSGVTNTEFSDEAFKGYYNLETLVLPASLQRVSYMMVAGCKNLKSIDIPASVEEIDQSAFEDCRSLETITFGGKQPSSKPGLRMATAAESKLRRIGNWAFYNAHELQHLEIPEGVEEIGDAAFYGCTYLQDMVLPSTVKSIGDNCFALCSKLQKITIKAVTPPTIYARTFYDVSRAIPVFVPDEAVEAYNDASYWQDMNIQGKKTQESIDEITNSSNSEILKFVKDGQLFILRDGKIYTITGTEVK